MLKNSKFWLMIMILLGTGAIAAGFPGCGSSNGDSVVFYGAGR
ncbi:MAG: hypothetical protein P4M08_01105 [Oligoflexia bacterium]|nr:hypothetical protein [Oligoflexia bacterium]